MIKLVVFDAYGVILNGGYPSTCKFLGDKYYRDWRELYEIFYKKYFNMAAEKKITQEAAWHLALRESRVHISVEEVKKIHYSLMSVNDEVRDFIVGLKGKTKRILLTKNTKPQLDDCEEKMDFFKYFDEIINTWKLNMPKASERIMNYILERFNLKPEEVLYIDDQEGNLLAARKLKIKTILFENFEQFTSDFNKIFK